MHQAFKRIDMLILFLSLGLGGRCLLLVTFSMTGPLGLLRIQEMDSQRNLFMQFYLLKNLFEKPCDSQEACAVKLPWRCVWCTVSKG